MVLCDVSKVLGGSILCLSLLLLLFWRLSVVLLCSLLYWLVSQCVNVCCLGRHDT